MSKAHKDQRLIYWFKELGIKDVPIVGGKNASLGEMYANLTSKGVQVPNGFAISAYAYDYYINASGIRKEIESLLSGLDPKNMEQLAKVGDKIRGLIRSAPLPADLEKAIIDAYKELCTMYGTEVDTAVRSSATAEDLPDASFAGQQDTYLNVHGNTALLEACRNCFASLFTDRAIAYRAEKNFDHFKVALSIAVQKMVRSDLASAGVMFSIDTESGFTDVVYITGGYGLGESVVQGSINPDEFYVHKPTLEKGHKSIVYSQVGAKQKKMVYATGGGKRVEDIEVPESERQKFCLTPDEVIQLAKWACIIEKHYSDEAKYYKPMDMEWAKDGQTGQLFIVQARPETVHSRRERGIIKRVTLEKTSRVLAQGMAVGDLIGTGKAHVIKSAKDINTFKPGSVLVTEMTDPDWVPIMKIASAIVTDMGGRTCHAAIISRELGIPCIVGTEGGSKAIPNGADITVSCSGGSKGLVYDGILPYKEQTIKLADLKIPKTKIWFNQGDPDRAFPESVIPHDGVGLVRMDELIRDEVQVHPLAAKAYAGWKKNGAHAQMVAKIEEVSFGFENKEVYFVTRLAETMGRIAAASYPKPVLVLLPDAPSRDLDRLAGGSEFGFDEANPLMGARGVARFTDLDYEEAVAMELAALVRARKELGMDNIHMMLPACHSERELKALNSLLEGQGLGRGKGMEHHMICRTPAQILDMASLAPSVDGFLIDVGELAQLVQGMDGYNVRVKPFFRENHPAVIHLVGEGIAAAKKLKKPVGVVNIAPGNFAAFAADKTILKADYLVIRPDTFHQVREALVG
ncbi:MAG: phosphoenolpyruvate synthase [Deltaproteobacteria bacterium]|nr:phosphoenolpyruvate synthase [Deltaproteobacteria bacterium]